jgi:hypothetical protein
MEVSGYLHAPIDLHLRKDSFKRVHLDWRLSGPQSWSGVFGKENTLSCWESNLGRPIHSLVQINYIPAMTCELSVAKHWERVRLRHCMHYVTAGRFLPKE